MPLLAAVQNAVFLSLPAVIYALSMARKGRPAADIVDRLGLVRGMLRPWRIALAACLPLGSAGAAASVRTKTFAGSALAGFVGASPTASVIVSATAYGVVAPGFPEELLFRGLIAGALFRRSSFWRANFLQASIFVLPHLLILLVAPRLWPLVIFLPLAFGVFAGWLRHSSGSMFPGALVHAVTNIACGLAVLRWHG